MPFEYFVRPFQSPDAHGRIVIPAAPQGFDQRATLTWGNKTSLDSTGDKGISVTTHWPDAADQGCCIEKLDEKSRTTVQKKIVDSHDPENWITVNRATELSLDKNHKNDCDAMAEWYNVQMNASDAAVMKNYDTLAKQMGVRTTEPERCKTTLKLNANTA
jgi:hypothetical protein